MNRMPGPDSSSSSSSGGGAQPRVARLPSPWASARFKPADGPLPMEHEVPPPRSGPPWWRRLARWLFYRDVPQARLRVPGRLAGELMQCPQCETRQPVAGLVCSHCGCPFVCILDTGFEQRRTVRRSLGIERWRLLLALGTLLFVLTNGVLLAGSNAEYEGLTTRAVASLRQADSGAVELSGPEPFKARTRLALGLLEQRAPDYYHRILQSVASIEYLPAHVLERDGGRTLNLEGIGAVALPHERRVLVLVDTAFPSGMGELWDRDIYTYAGTLVHELRHIELHYNGAELGTVEEEVACEQAAYDALRSAQAPGGVLARYELYFANPNAGRYQRWYDFYQQ